jgi:hypothetical protein
VSRAARDQPQRVGHPSRVVYFRRGHSHESRFRFRVAFPFVLPPPSAIEFA